MNFQTLSRTILAAGLVLTTLSSPNQAEAKEKRLAGPYSLDLFHKMVQVERSKTGQLIQLKIKASLTKAVPSDENVSVVSKIMLDALSEARNEALFSSLAQNDLDTTNWTPDEIKTYQDAKQLLRSSRDLDILLENKELNAILRDVQNKLEALAQFNVLARPSEPGYFHNRTMIDKVIKQANTLVDKLFGTTPAGRVASFLVHTLVGWSDSKRTYCQQVLLYYIEKVPAKELGFTNDEVALIKSSLYEREIAWWDLKKAEKVKKEWATFGTTAMRQDVKNNSARLGKYGPAHGKANANLSAAFSTIDKDGLSWIYNTKNPASKVSKDLSLAFDPKEPKRLQKIRIALNLAQLAAQLLPGPVLIIDQITNLIGSHFKEQSMTEGALFAYLSTEGQNAKAKIILEQTLNPFIIKDLK